MTKRVLLTGATGYVGRHVLGALLRDGHSVAAIVRRRGGRLAERLERVTVPGASLRVFEGDVTAPLCGLAPEQVCSLAGGVDAMVHCAGLTEFDDGLADELLRQNVGGTRHALDLCSELRIAHLHHVSTAFVAGDVPGVFCQRDPGGAGRFRNPYESSKFEAERVLRSAADRPVIVSIYRPSIVAGGRVLGEDGSAGTLYAYLKALWFVRECMRRDEQRGGKLRGRCGASRRESVWNIPLRIEAASDVRVNLVHVDDVAERVSRGVHRPPGSSGTYHVVSPGTFSAEEIKDEFCRMLGLEGVRLEPASSFESAPPNGLEQKFRRMTDAFLPYLFRMPSFECTGPARPVSPAQVAGDFLAELESKEWARERRALGPAAVECLDAARPGRYLDKFSGGQFGESFLKRIPYAAAVVRFEITGRGGSSRTLVFDNGTVRGAKGGEADVTYEMDETVFRRVVGGELDPREAFFNGELKIRGDQELALKFGYAFADHFSNIEGRILEELEEAGG